MVLLAPASKIPKDRTWNAAKLMMAKVHVTYMLRTMDLSAQTLGLWYSNVYRSKEQQYIWLDIVSTGTNNY